MDYPKKTDSAINVLDYALRLYYTDELVTAICYEKEWMDNFKEIEFSTERMKYASAKAVADNILGLLDLQVTRAGGIVVVHKYQRRLTTL